MRTEPARISLSFPLDFGELEFSSSFIEAFDLVNMDYIATLEFYDHDGTRLPDSAVGAPVTALDNRPFRYFARPIPEAPVITVERIKLSEPARSVTIAIYPWAARDGALDLQSSIRDSLVVKGLSWKEKLPFVFKG